MKLNGKDIYLSFLKGKSFEYRGEYNPKATYYNTSTIIDCFAYAGNSYYTKQTAPAGTSPTDTTYFGVMASGSVPAELSGFIEAERQKSKNLCKLKPTVYSSAGITATFDTQNQTITLNGTASQAVDLMSGLRNLYPNIQNAQEKTFTISYTYVSGSVQNHYAAIYFGSPDVYIYGNRFGGISISTENYTNSRGDTFTIRNNQTYDCIFFYIPEGTIVDNLTFKLQIEEGNTPTVWTYPYGATVHEEDIEDVEHIEIIYDKNSADSKLNWGYTSGINGNVTKIFNRNYKQLKIFYRCYYDNNQLNTGGTSNIIWLDLTQIENGYATASNLNLYKKNYSEFSTDNTFGIFVEYNTSTGDFGAQFAYNSTQELYVNTYHVYKIEGVY